MKPQKKRFVILFLTVVLPLSGFFSGALAQTPSPEGTPLTESGPVPKKSVVEKLNELEAKNQELESRLQLLEDKAKPTATPEAVSMENKDADETEGGPAGDMDNASGNQGGSFDEEGRHLDFSDKSGNAVFRVGGYTYAQANLYFHPASEYLLNDAGKSPNEFNGFLPRKAHIDLGGYFDKFVGMTIGLESDKSTAASIGFYHAYVYVKFDKALIFQAGKFSNPLSLEAYQPSPDLLFEEPSMVADLVPNKDFGVMIRGKVKKLGQYWLDVANGGQDNESSATFPGKPAQDGKALTARVFLEPFKKSKDDFFSNLKGLGFGIGGGWANEANAGPAGSSTPGENSPWPAIQTSLGSNVFLTYGASVLAQGDFYHWDPHFFYYNGPFGLMGEYVQSIQTVGVADKPSVQLTNSAWLLEGSWVFGGKAGYEGVDVEENFDLSKGKLGALEIAARVHQLFADVNSFATGQPFNQTPATPLASGPQLATAFGLGVNWWFNPHFKWMFDIERTEFSGGNLAVNPEQVFIARAAFIL